MAIAPDHGNAVEYFVDRHASEGRGDARGVPGSLAIADLWRA